MAWLSFDVGCVTAELVGDPFDQEPELGGQVVVAEQIFEQVGVDEVADGPPVGLDVVGAAASVGCQDLPRRLGGGGEPYVGERSGWDSEAGPFGGCFGCEETVGTV